MEKLTFTSQKEVRVNGWKKIELTWINKENFISTCF